MMEKQTTAATTTQDANSRQARGWLRTAALAAAVMVIASADAHAQFRSDNNGRALDASNRVGSGGSNGEAGDNRVGGPVSGNQIVTGNVTGGKEFRGFVPYSDPNEFRGPSGFGRSDRLVRNSAGPNRSSTLLQSPRSFYGSDLAAPLPPSYVPTPGATGGWVQQTPMTINGPAEVGFAGIRPGSTGIYGGSLEGPTQAGAAFGGQLDANPLFGVRPLGANQSPLDALRTDPLFSTSGDARLANDAAIRQMRDELNQAAGGGRATPDGLGGGGNPNARPGTPGGTGNDANNSNGPGTPGAGVPLDSSLGSPVSSSVSGLQNGSLNSAVPAGAVSGGVATGQGTRSRLLVPPAEQSRQYKELVRRMESRTGETSAGQAAADRNQLMKAWEQAKKGGAGKPGEAAQPPAPGGPAGQPRTPAAPPMVRPAPRGPADAIPKPAGPAVQGPVAPTEPLEIKSLATGVEAKGLATLLTSAEQSMKEQKYDTAVAQFDQAGRVAPNNPMITLGRSIALLGGGNYGQAEISLRRAIGAEPALLLGRYDLNGMMTPERAQFLTKDLKAVAAANPKEVRPRLLLAFLAYNTGNGPDASKYLAEAAALAPNDEAVQSMQKTWAVVGNDAGVTPPAPPAELNK
jgi:tetratricopeptide (TPR) repeat protein